MYMYAKIIENLREQQQKMGIPYEIIAERTNLGIATVKRAFLGKNVSMSTLESIAITLECNINLISNKSAEKLLEEQIEKKALLTVNRVMHSATLEEQRPKSKAYEAMLIKARRQISQMPKSYIWS